VSKKKQLRQPWVPGESGNPKGRPLGSRTKLSEKFILCLHDDFVEHGSAVIEQVRQERPEIYLKIIASIVPRELHFRGANAFDGMTDDELSAFLVDVRRSLSARAGEGSPEGSHTPSVGSKLN
jgi:hypothetical protein